MRLSLLLIIILALSAGCSSSSNRVTVNDTSSSDSDLHQGKIFYMKDCAACHGDRGDGKGIVADKLPVKPISFLSSSNFKYGSELDDVATTIMYGIPNTPMVHGFQSLYVEEDVIKIAKYIYSLRKE